MGQSGLCCLFLLVSVFGLFEAAQPEPEQDGAVIYACVGNDVIFPWSRNLKDDEKVNSIRWLFSSHLITPAETIAILNNGAFVLLAPAYSTRIQQTTNGDLVLSHVTAEDSGNYTAEVTVKYQESEEKVQTRTLTLQVNSDLPTSDGKLHVQQQPDAVQDSTTQQWSLVLSCGHFLDQVQPPVLVEWLSPSGDILTSTNYKDGFFHLHLANPIEDGSYTCRIPQQHVASACLHGNTLYQDSIAVDRTEARMTLLETEMRSLRQDKLQLDQRVVALQDDLTRQASENNAKLSLMINESKTPLVGFNARAIFAQVLSPPSHILFNDVLYNAGLGYNSTTGVFEAPVRGAYFLMFHTRGYNGVFSNTIMKLNDVEVCRQYGKFDEDHGSCHAVVHMQEGDKAWMEPYQGTGRTAPHFNAWGTSFAGFLFYADP